MNKEFKFADMDKTLQRLDVAKDFYNIVLDPDEHPIIVTDEASFYDIYMGDIPEAIEIIHKNYNVLLTEEDLSQPFWQLLDFLYK